MLPHVLPITGQELGKAGVVGSKYACAWGILEVWRTPVLLAGEQISPALQLRETIADIEACLADTPQTVHPRNADLSGSC